LIGPSPPKTKKKLKVETIELPEIGSRFYLQMRFLSLWPTYIGEKGRTLGKTYGIKVRCYWGHIGNI
jgi:hypothetical protein